jgi:hypothetical protein
LGYALAGALAVLAWQAATVHFNYGGNWTALFCTGQKSAPPPELASGTYLFPDSSGYDGQYYRYVAHDPWFQKGWQRYQDSVKIRYRRMLLPALAWLSAGGQAPFIDRAYIAWVLISVAAGIYWLVRLAESQGRHPVWGLVFVAFPATLVSIDRMTVDVALAALCVGFVWYARQEKAVALLVLLTLAALVRDTGLILIGACCAFELGKRAWRRAVFFALTALPAVAWYGFVAAHTAARPRGRSSILIPGWFFHNPATAIAAKLFHPEPYPWEATLTHLVQAMDFFALAGFLVIIGAGVRLLRQRPYDREQWALLGLLGLAVAASTPPLWANAYNYARPFTPLIFLVAWREVGAGRLWILLPLGVIDLRIAAQLAPQAVGIVRGIM